MQVEQTFLPLEGGFGLALRPNDLFDNRERKLSKTFVFISNITPVSINMTIQLLFGFLTGTAL